MAAHRAGGVLVPMGSAVRSGRTFHQAWDRFVLAWPFSEVAVVLGPPMSPSIARCGEGQEGQEGQALAVAIRNANERASLTLTGAEGKMLESQGFSALEHGPAPVFERD